MKELQVIDITREKRQLLRIKEKRNISWKIKKLWREWGLSKDDLWCLLAAIGIMIQIPFIFWIFAATIP